MHTIPVALDRLHTPLCAAAPEPKHDPATGKARIDYQGNPLWTIATVVHLAGHRKPSVIDISIAYKPEGIAVGTPLRIIDLDAVPWALHGHVGVSFKAAQILPCDSPDR